MLVVRERTPNGAGFGVEASPPRRAILWMMRSCVGLLDMSESSLGGSLRGSNSMDMKPMPLSTSGAVKVKVHFHEDIFVIQVARVTEYNELVEKVGKKIRLCGRDRDDGPLRVKYRDEDGDMVSLGSTEDVQMAFEAYRPGGQVTLYVQ